MTFYKMLITFGTIIIGRPIYNWKNKFPRSDKYIFDSYELNLNDKGQKYKKMYNVYQTTQKIA